MTAIGFLLIVVVVSGFGGLVLWLQHREPNTLESGLDAFRREMDALAPPSDQPREQVRRLKRPSRPNDPGHRERGR